MSNVDAQNVVYREPRLHSSAAIGKVLEREGFAFISQTGRHAKYRKEGPPKVTVIVPAARREIPRGTFGSIVARAGLDESAFDPV
jgi:predicted RNA binding protein YcfA (HicA-like mRNA interferase family)